MMTGPGKAGDATSSTEAIWASAQTSTQQASNARQK